MSELQWGNRCMLAPQCRDGLCQSYTSKVNECKTNSPPLQGKKEKERREWKRGEREREKEKKRKEKKKGGGREERKEYYRSQHWVTWRWVILVGHLETWARIVVPHGKFWNPRPMLLFPAPGHCSLWHVFVPRLVFGFPMQAVSPSNLNQIR